MEVIPQMQAPEIRIDSEDADSVNQMMEVEEEGEPYEEISRALVE